MGRDGFRLGRQPLNPFKIKPFSVHHPNNNTKFDYAFFVFYTTIFVFF